MEAVSYELWDVEGGNIIGAFEAEDEALYVARILLDADASQQAGDLLLICRDGEKEARVIARGESLVNRARQGGATTPRVATGASQP